MRPVGRLRRWGKGRSRQSPKKRETSLAEVEALKLFDDREEWRKLYKLANRQTIVYQEDGPTGPTQKQMNNFFFKKDSDLV